MTEAINPSSESFRTADADIDRELLTETLFRCISDCDNEEEIENLRGQVVSINMGIAESLARHYYGRGENNDDLLQVAYLGLVKAARGFHSELGNNFLSYAVPTITGELKKHFRDHCWTVRPPRRIQDLQREISSARQTLSQDVSRQPTTQEIADELDVSVRQVSEAAAAQGCFSPNSLDVPLSADSTATLGDMIPGADRDFERVDAYLILAPMMRRLSEEDREILTLRFYEEWTQQQIAEKLGTSQMQISRRLSRLMKQLRSSLEPAYQCA